MISTAPARRALRQRRKALAAVLATYDQKLRGDTYLRCCTITDEVGWRDRLGLLSAKSCEAEDA